MAVRSVHVSDSRSAFFGRTITTHRQVNDIADANIDDSKESLVLLFEFLLVKDLDRKNAVLVDSPVKNDSMVNNVHPFP